MSNLTVNPPNGRGCGYRDEDAVYLCCGTGPGGMPIEYFINDPVVPWVGGWSRGMKILPRTKDGINDIVIFIGRGVGGSEELYPFYWDFIEEARLYGVSRKGNKNIPFHKLTPGASYMLFVHAHAIPQFNFEIYRPEWIDIAAPRCKRPGGNLTEGGELPELHNDANLSPCTFAVKDLSILSHRSNFKKVDDLSYRIEGPSYGYECRYPIIPNLEIPDGDELPWGPGIFMTLPLTHIEAKNKLDPETIEKINQAGYAVEVLEY